MAATQGKTNELRITRIYDAPVKAVWDAWTDLEQVAKWWGPRGFTLTTHSKDLRAGGHWSYTMHGPDGKDWENRTKYYEVEPMKKLVYDHGANDTQPPLFRVTALFIDLKGGKTKLDMTMSFATAAVAVEMAKFIKQAGGNSTWDRLAEYLEKESSGKETFVINRTFDAPIDVMFEMWTDPKHLSQWLPPTGFTMELIKSSIKPGERTFWMMSNGAGVKMYGHCAYLQIEKPHSIVYTQQFADEHENVSRHPGAPIWPETMLTTVKLTEEGTERTRVTVTWEPHGATTREELE